MKHKTSLLACCAVVWMGVWLGACKEKEAPPLKENFPKFDQRFFAALRRAASCEELETHARNAAFVRIQTDYSWRLEHALEQLRTADEETCLYGHRDVAISVPETAEAGGGNAPPKAESGEAGQVSATNNQIAEVDEADIVKADTQHMYIAKGNQLRVFKAWPPDEAVPLSSTPIEGQAKRLLKVGNRLLVISFVADSFAGGYYPTSASSNASFLDPYIPYYSRTVLTLFDVETPDSPKAIRKINLHARFETARSIGSNAILVLSRAEPFFLNHFWWPDICDGKKPTSEKKLRTSYTRALNEVYQELLSFPGGQFGLRVEDSLFADAYPRCNNVFFNQMPDGAEQTTVVRLDLSADTQAPLESATLLSRTGEVFVSKRNVYMAVPQWRAPDTPWFANWEESTHVSLVHKFALPEGNPSPAYVASGIVKGNVLNSFSMDEDEASGFLRMATSTPQIWWQNNSRPRENVVSVLRQEGDSLLLHGQLDNIAPNEQIYSARFVGERAYVVTFLRVDPLFVIDLSNPAAPHILGELKVPGFSTYIHPLSADRLLTVGYNADDRGFTQGIQAQLFDVSNPQAPRSVDVFQLSRHSSSEAAYNHLGFAYNPTLRLLALPATEWSPHPEYGYMDSISFEGVRLLRVDAEKGFEPLGNIQHPKLPSSSPYYSSPVLRNVFMLEKADGSSAQNFLYSLSNSALFSTQLPSSPQMGAPLPLIQSFPLNNP